MCIRVMLADDHVLVRKGIKGLLEAEGECRVVEEAENGEECIEKLKFSRAEIQLLVLDLFMPGKNGMEVLGEIRKLMLDIKVLILTGCSRKDCLWDAMDAGADGYLSKDAEPSELKTAIQTIINDKKYIQAKWQTEFNVNESNFTEKCAGEDRCRDREKIELLTKREKEVLIQAAGGRLNKEIADELKISERTVKNHLSSIFRKIDVLDRTQAAVFAIRNHIVELKG